MASERIKLSNKSPIVGDLVFVDGSDDRGEYDILGYQLF